MHTASLWTVYLTVQIRMTYALGLIPAGCAHVSHPAARAAAHAERSRGERKNASKGTCIFQSPLVPPLAPTGGGNTCVSICLCERVRLGGEGS